jgi:hypothetical protein
MRKWTYEFLSCPVSLDDDEESIVKFAQAIVNLSDSEIIAQINPTWDPKLPPCPYAVTLDETQ